MEGGRRMTRKKFIGLSAAAALAPTLAEVPARRAVVFEISKLATHDGPGLRTVAFLKGCPLRCIWCHSPESWRYEIEKYSNGETIGREMSVDELLEVVLKDKDFFDASGGGVTLSGGEALAHPEFCVQFFAKAKAAGVHTAIETSGYAKAKMVERLLPYVDLWLYDIKHLDPAKCLEYTHCQLAPVLSNLRLIDRELRGVEGRSVVMRCPMIPGINDDEAELVKVGALADELASVARIDVIPYVPYGIDKAKRLGLKVYEAPQPPPEYGPAKVAELAKFTKKTVRLG